MEHVLRHISKPRIEGQHDTEVEEKAEEVVHNSMARVLKHVPKLKSPHDMEVEGERTRKFERDLRDIKLKLLYYFNTMKALRS